MAHLSIGNSVTAGEPPIHAEKILITAFSAGKPSEFADKDRNIASGYQNSITTRDVTIGGYN